MLISEIIQECMGDLGCDTADTTLVALFLTWVKGTLRRFPLFTRGRIINTTSTITLSLGANSASLPTGFLREIIVYRKSDGKDIEIEKHPNFKLVVNTGTSGTPLYYEIIGSTIYFDKNADADYTVYIEHSKEIDNVATGDTWAYTSTMIEVLKDGMKGYYYKHTEDDVNARESFSLMKTGLDELDTQYMIDSQGKSIEES